MTQLKHLNSKTARISNELTIILKGVTQIKNIRFVGIITIILFLCLLATSVKAQENQRYQGQLNVSGYIGVADYTYLLANGDTILNGPFRLRKANLDALLQEEDYSFDFSGSFKNNFPTGTWKFQFGTFQSNNESQVVDYQYRVAISGIQEKATGNMLNGKPDGTWLYSVDKIEDSEITKTLFKSDITFNNGVPQRNFKIENDSLTLAGRFLRNGLAHDEWSLFETTGLGAAENWFFNDGVLQSIQNDVNGNIITNIVYKNIPRQTKTINLDTRYIKAITAWQSLENIANPVVTSKMQNLLAENATYYKKIDGILSELGESAFLPEFKVKVPLFPLTAMEQQKLDSIQSQFNATKEISSSFLENTQLNILKLSDAEAAYLYGVVAKINQDFLNPIGQFLAYKNENILEFLPKEKLIKNLWVKGKPKTQINVQVVIDSVTSNQNFELNEAADFDNSSNTIHTVQQLIEYASLSLAEVKTSLGKKLVNEQRQQELVKLEEGLITKDKVLQQFIDSANTVGTNKQQKALLQLKKIADTKLSYYSSIENIKLKLDAAQKLSACYEQFFDLAQSIVALPKEWVRIQETYQDRIWNPFMATLMDEDVKKRITGAYRKVLIPSYLDSIDTELTCKEASELNHLMKSTHQRMLELREENTSKLERKLRKKTDPKVVLKLFGLATEKEQK